MNEEESTRNCPLASRSLKWLAGVLVIVGAGAYTRHRFLYARHPETTLRKSEEVVAVSARTVTTKTLREKIRVAGDIKPLRRVELAPKLQGRLERLRLDNGTPIEEGMRVRKGEVVAVIDRDVLLAQAKQAEASLEALLAEKEKMDRGARPEELEIARAQVASAEALVKQAESAVAEADATLKNATRNLERMRKLFADRVITKQKLDDFETQCTVCKQKYLSALQMKEEALKKLSMAAAKLKLVEKGAREEDRKALEANIKRARAALELAKEQLEEATIRSPINGVVAHKYLDEGNLLSPGMPILSIIDIDTVKIIASVPQSYASKLVEGKTSVLVTVKGYEGWSWKGTLWRVYPEADARMRTLTVEARVPNTDARLKPGLYATLDVILTERRNVPFVKPGEFIERKGKKYAYILEGGRAKKTGITLGIREGERIEVLKGLKPGDTLITSSLAKLTDGSPVRVLGEIEK